jgi:hypothetical protein
MIEEDENESPQVTMDKTDKEAQDRCPAFDTMIVKLTTLLLRKMTASSWQWCIWLILTILSML